jgi:hypothetical protein
MRGADEIAGRPFAIDVAGGYSGGTRVLFSSNPITAGRTTPRFHGVQHDNWNDLGTRKGATAPTGGVR